MAFTISQEMLNRSLVDKRVDKFYVSFYRFPDNQSNILGRQLVSLERPSVTFNSFQTRYKGTIQTNNAQLSFQPINIMFKDDNANLTTLILYKQLYRQAGLLDQSLMENTEANNILGSRTFDKSKFDIGVKVYGADNAIVEQYLIKQCFIVGITHSQYIYKSTDNNLITCSVSFDNIDYYDIDALNPFSEFEVDPAV